MIQHTYIRLLDFMVNLQKLCTCCMAYLQFFK